MPCADGACELRNVSVLVLEFMPGGSLRACLAAGRRTGIDVFARAGMATRRGPALPNAIAQFRMQ